MQSTAQSNPRPSSTYYSCIVPMCTNNTIKTPDKIFFGVPKNAKRRQRWINAAKRNYKDFSQCSGIYVCEDHFDLQNDMENYIRWKLIGGKKYMKTDVVPHKFDCQKSRKRKLPQTSQPASIKRERLSLFEEVLFESGVENEAPEQNKKSQIEPTNIINNAVKTKKEIGVQFRPPYRSKAIQCKINLPVVSERCSPMKTNKLDMAISPTIIEMSNDRSEFLASLESSQDELVQNSSDYSLEECNSSKSEDENNIRSGEITKLSLNSTINIIKQHPRRYLGVSENVSFILDEIQKFTDLSIINIYLTLKKIRLSQTFAELGDDFDISESTANRIFSNSVVLISEAIKELVVWPPKEKIREMLPITFRAQYAKVQSIIIDCLEIKIQKPSASVQQALTWSQYKNANTIKYLISTTSDGIINFISTGFGGRASDSLIIEKSGFLETLQPNTVVMANSGFKHIDHFIIKKNCMLLRPPSLESKKKLDRTQVLRIKQITSLQIHVEQVRRVREFNMLTPHSCISRKLIPYMDHVIIIACGLINLQGPLIYK